MPKIITEDMIEQAAIKALQERHNYTVLNCMTEEPDTLPDGTGRKDKKQVVLPDVMLESLCRINPDIPEQTVRTVVDELCHTPVSGDLMLTNYQNYQEIRNGITVEYNKDGKKTSNIFRLLSYNDALTVTVKIKKSLPPSARQLMQVYSFAARRSLSKHLSAMSMWIRRSLRTGGALFWNRKRVI